MKELLQNLQIKVNDKTFLKDPESSKLGKRILESSIILIEDLGFDNFTFKKLAQEINSTESSVYRYFENKHKLLLYLASWYWAWIEYQLVIETFSISNVTEKLEATINIVTRRVETDSNFSHIDEVKLNRIIVNEYSKSFLTKEVDKENKEGYFTIYKRLVQRINEAIQAVNENYAYSNSLASTILEGALHQHFLKEHFPTLTNCDTQITPADFFKNLVFGILNTAHNEK